MNYIVEKSQQYHDQLQSILDQLSLPSQNLGMDLRIDLCKMALSLINKNEKPALWAAIFGELGNSLRRNPAGDRAANVEEAIQCYTQSLEVMTRDTMSVEWAAITANLATAYFSRIRGNRADNIEKAIECYSQSLEVITRDAMPDKWAGTMMNVANAYRNRLLGNRTENIEEALRYFNAASKVFTRNAMPVEWSALMMNIATTYYTRIRGDRPENIEKAIRYHEQSLEVRTYDTMPAEWATTMMNLGTAYYSRIRGNRADNLEEAIRNYRQALKVRTFDTRPTEWAEAMMNLANGYYFRIRGDRSENIENAIRYYTQALVVRSPDAMPIECALTRMNLASAYFSRIRGNREDNIEQAIRLYKQSLAVRTRSDMPIEWANTMMNIANAYYFRIRGDRANNIEKVIHCHEQALEVLTRSAMPVEWATIMMNLANAYYSRIRGNRAENIEQAVRCCRQVLEIKTRDAFPLEWANTMMNLGNAYSSRIRGDHVDNIEQAIHCYRQALEVRIFKEMPLEWATTLMNLAIAYVSRIRGNREANIEQAIQCYQQTLKVITRRALPLEWAAVMMNLGNAYRNRTKGDRAQNIEEAIQCYGDALTVLTHDAMPVEWAGTIMNYATAYCYRTQGDRSDNIEKAIRFYQQALKVRTRDAMPVEWAEVKMNLANAYYARRRGKRSDNIEEAIHFYEQALKIRSLDAMPSDHRQVQRNLGNLCLNERRWIGAKKAFAGMLAANEILYKAGALPESRYSELLAIKGMPACAAYATLKSAKPVEVPVALKECVEVLERNRARWLSEALALKREKPEVVPDKVWSEFHKNREKYNELLVESRLPENTPGKRTFLEMGAAMQNVSKMLDATLVEVRNHDSTFMPDPDLKQIQSAVIPEKDMLVYIAVTPVGSLAFFVRSEKQPVNYIWLDDLTDGTLTENLQEYSAAYGRWRANTKDKEARKNWLNTLDIITNRLWPSLMGPITEKILELGITNAILFAHGLLGLLPLHAAWTEENGKRRYAMDDICYTYAPNALSLSACREIAQQVKTERLLAIDEPLTENVSPLPNSNAEVTAICSHFNRKTILPDETATRKAVGEVLPGLDVFHFSCHGMVDFDEPLNSGLLMANDETLTLRDFLSTECINARLAVLSACETGIPNLKNADEVIGLPAGLVQAGVAGVVASLWSVSDLSTMILMIRFYEFWRKDNLESPEALRQAQIWVRDTTNGQKASYFGSFLPEFGKAEKQGIPVHLADKLYKRFAFENPDENDFEHPFYWAAFGYTGV